MSLCLTVTPCSVPESKTPSNETLKLCAMPKSTEKMPIQCSGGTLSFRVLQFPYSRQIIDRQKKKQPSKKRQIQHMFFNQLKQADVIHHPIPRDSLPETRHILSITDPFSASSLSQRDQLV